MLAYLLASLPDLSIPDPWGDLLTTFLAIVVLMSAAGYSFSYGWYWGRRGAMELESTIRNRTRYRRENAATVRDTRTGTPFYAPEF